ncbi:MAG: UvrD-helicase domain-containing protein, partial [Kiloniellaceae bacterium]
DRARTLFARVLDAPGGMKIQTIHAFCQSLLGRFPLEAGIAPHFRVLDEAAATGMLREARLEVLAAARVGARDDPLTTALAEVSTHALEDAFMKLMASLAAERARLAHALARHGGIEGVERAVFRLLDVEPEDTPEATMRLACADQAFDSPGLRAAAEALAKGSKTDLEKAAALDAWLNADTPTRATQFGAYRLVFLTGKGERRKRPMTKAVCAASPMGLAAVEAEAERLLAIDRRINALVVARATAGLLRLGAAILAAYARAKKARALLDYDDLILMARDLLRREGLAGWVLFKLDGGLDHVLIDEAQDTNPEQWQVIDMLSAEFFAGAGAHDAPRTVFAVGDAKQSIYSFQRADPSAFARMRDHFAERARAVEQTWSNVELDYSFRSNAAILRAVDAVFAREPASDGVLFGADALSHRPVRMGQAGLVELWPPAAPGPDNEPAHWDSPVTRHGATPGHTRLAQAIAHRIWRWTLESDPATAPGPGDEAWLDSRNRRLRPGDILVLVRRRNAFVAELVRDLKRRGVPVSGVDRMVLCDQIAVMDLIALGRVLLLPEDDLTLATVLKGPFLGLNEDTLFALAHGRSGTLWQSLAAHAKGLPAARDAYERLKALMARADFVPPYELYSEILNGEWRGARGRQLLLARLGADANDPIEEFLSLALAHGRENVPSLEGFLHWIEIGAQEVKRNMEIGADAVRVMTVHGAKGLQAPVVILPDTMQVPKPKDGLFWLDED